MKNKFNKELFEQELKRFKLISEYTFITGDDKKPLVLGDKSIDEDETQTPDDLQPAAEKVAADLDIDTNTGDETSPAPDAGNDGGPDMGGEANAEPDMGGDEQPEMPTPEENPGEEMASDEVEVDVSSLVKGSEEAKASADRATKNTEMLMSKLTDLEKRIAHMSTISDKIEGLEKEIIKRNPTPVEKLEMRSLDSYPFNQKLSDYWNDKEGAYDVMDNKKEEYVLTKDDVNNTYNTAGVRDSFNLNESLYEEETLSDFEEEDI